MQQPPSKSRKFIAMLVEVMVFTGIWLGLIEAFCLMEISAIQYLYNPHHLPQAGGAILPFLAAALSGGVLFFTSWLLSIYISLFFYQFTLNGFKQAKEYMMRNHKFNYLLVGFSVFAICSYLLGYNLKYQIQAYIPVDSNLYVLLIIFFVASLSGLIFYKSYQKKHTQ